MRLGVVLLLVYFCVGDDNPTILGEDPFDLSICSVRICAGYAEGPLSWWIYKQNSYTNGSSSNAPDQIDDDDYLNVSPLSLLLCQDSACKTVIETISFQDETANENAVTTSSFNGASAYRVDYTVKKTDNSGNNVQVQISTYLLERTAEIIQQDENIELPENDFVIAFNTTWDNLGSDKFFQYQFNIYNKGAGNSTWVSGNEVFLSPDANDQIGYSLNYASQYYSTSFSNVSRVFVSGGGGTGVTFPSASFTSYNVYVASGHTIRKGWAIFMAIIGAILIAILLAVGCFGYFIKRRKRSINDPIASSYGTLSQSDSDLY